LNLFGRLLAELQEDYLVMSLLSILIWHDSNLHLFEHSVWSIAKRDGMLLPASLMLKLLYPISISRPLQPIVAVDFGDCRTSDDIPVSRFYGSDELPAVVRSLFSDLIQRAAKPRDDTSHSTQIISKIYLTGGWSTLPAFQLIQDWPLPAIFARSVFRSGNLNKEVMMCDLGRSSLKIGFRGIFRNFARNFTLLPASAPPGSWSVKSQRRALVNFIGEKIRSVLHETEASPRRILFASPACSAESRKFHYLGLSEEEGPVAEYLNHAGITDAEILDLTGIELAAIQAVLDDHSLQSEDFIVLSLGVTPMAAVVSGRAALSAAHSPGVAAVAMSNL
jgi:hypothetical protein